MTSRSTASEPPFGLLASAKSVTHVPGLFWYLCPRVVPPHRLTRPCSRPAWRKLSENGVTYQTLLDQVRRDLAVDYLRNSLLTVEQIAELVGYGEAASFRKALRRWTGKAPGEFRGRDARSGSPLAAGRPPAS